jgi:hypothetical protein
MCFAIDMNETAFHNGGKLPVADSQISIVSSYYDSEEEEDVEVLII